MTKDPVCGMQVDETTASLKADYEGNTFFFCGTSCKDKFTKQPKEYPAGAAKSSGCCCSK